MGPRQVIWGELTVTHYVHGMVPRAAWLLARLELLFALCAGLSCLLGVGPTSHLCNWASCRALGTEQLSRCSRCMPAGPTFRRVPLLCPAPRPVHAGAMSTGVLDDLLGLACSDTGNFLSARPAPTPGRWCKQGEIYGRLCLSGEPGGFHSPISRPCCSCPSRGVGRGPHFQVGGTQFREHSGHGIIPGSCGGGQCFFSFNIWSLFSQPLVPSLQAEVWSCEHILPWMP